jgi:hypothetical protein
MIVQESFYRAQLLERCAFSPHRVLDLAYLRRAAGTREISQCISYLPGLENLLCRSGLYMEKWIRVFYAIVWVDPAHDFFWFGFEGETYRIFSHEIRA